MDNACEECGGTGRVGDERDRRGYLIATCWCPEGIRLRELIEEARLEDRLEARAERLGYRT